MERMPASCYILEKLPLNAFRTYLLRALLLSKKTFLLMVDFLSTILLLLSPHFRVMSNLPSMYVPWFLHL